MTWELVDAPEGWLDPPDAKQHGNRGLGGYQCYCGRFAKYLGDRHYYNGTWDLYQYTVRCSRCGDVTVQCV